MARQSLHQFIRTTRYEGLPSAVRAMATRCLVDLAGAAAAGLQTELSAIIREHAVESFGAGAGAPRARLLFDGRTAGLSGAALAGGMTIDSFDSHDGHVLTKGHAGVAILPGLLALADAVPAPMSGGDFLASLVIGYEVAIRAGIAQHATAADYHTSGAWNALGVAAVAGRVWEFDESTMRHALGIAEYHGPRSQMMRCIDHPTMLKDGSGWGAMTGISAACLAARGFTGAPALVVESDAVGDLWSDLGERWRILELYFKPYPVCRWAQPAIEAALRVRLQHDLRAADIAAVEIETFHEATRLDQHCPASTEEAQYSLPFPVGAALVRGSLHPEDIIGPALEDPEILAMSRRIRLVEAADLNARFPAERLARARLMLADGRVLRSETMPARGDAERPLTDNEISAKFHALAGGALGRPAATALLDTMAQVPGAASVGALLDSLLSPPQAGRRDAVVAA
jgi:2-methylcitrate dehydratase PrpD